MAQVGTNSLAGPQLRSFRAHAATCSHCAQVLREAGLSVFGPVRRAPTRRLWLAALMAALAVALVLGWVRWRGAPAAAAVARSPAFSFWMAAERDGKPFRVQASTPLRTGDRLAFFYTAAHDGYLAMLFLEESGATTWLFPAHGEPSARVKADADHPLADGAVLTEHSGCEWVLGAFSAEPLSHPALRALAADALVHRTGCELDLAGLARPGAVELQVHRLRR